MSEQERKGTHYRFATIAALTERGGRISTASKMKLCGLGIARVGDVVTYPGGSQAVIVDGAGYAATIDNRAAALVGSHLSNGDRIIETPWGHLAKGLFIEDGTEVPGLFDASWTPPQREPLARFAVFGATTARGGMVREVSSDWEVDDTYRKAASIGDFVEYEDGTRARIITGVGMVGNERCRYAVIGSLLDNGDMITDSPHREPRTSTVFVPIDEHGVALTRQ
ncbi:PAAR domain-containing protein [Paraburkholderia sp. J76]|uniref:PAAR domain-containing protein n=1 Tax=Paraburkholderia sp. J76 TaxID=2805439 RepID=UPI002ABD80D6|nr:PAAR domain-containing protein [Paraburkholderia sp. J76]